jgi:hypothetical protein
LLFCKSVTLMACYFLVTCLEYSVYFFNYLISKFINYKVFKLKSRISNTGIQKINSIILLHLIYYSYNIILHNMRHNITYNNRGT